MATLNGFQIVKVSDSMPTLCRISQLRPDFMKRPFPRQEKCLFSLPKGERMVNLNRDSNAYSILCLKPNPVTDCLSSYFLAPTIPMFILNSIENRNGPQHEAMTCFEASENSKGNFFTQIRNSRCKWEVVGLF
jgi:hypothetical protein